MRTRFSLVSTLALGLAVAACSAPPEAVNSDSPITVGPEDGMVMDVTPQGTVNAVQSAGGLLRLSPGAAVANIDGWIARLDGDDRFDGIVDDLDMLRDELTEDEIDGMAVGRLLVDLGAETSAAATSGSALATLGRTLSESGRMLTSM